jgi:hypothetical protein
MAFELWALGSNLVVNLVIATGVVLAIYGLIETRKFLGAAGGAVLGGVIVYAQATAGAQFFDLTFEETRWFVAVAGTGAALGLVGTLVTIKPDIE